MGYYSGDYYRGDYYRGDPGFLSFLGGVAKTVGGFIPGVGPIISAAGGALEKLGAPKAVNAATSLAVTASKPGFFKGATSTLKSTVLKHPVLTGAGAAGLAGAAAGIAGTKLLSRGGGGMRKRRRMRATNPKALRRALRRAYAFERLAMKTIHLVHPRKKGRFGGFKRPRKRVA
jgi:hypothetical protein